jgi:hypothetical protein
MSKRGEPSSLSPFNDRFADGGFGPEGADECSQGWSEA